MDEVVKMADSSIKMVQIMDEMVRKTDSSTNTVQIMDEPQQFAHSSTKIAIIMDEARRQFSSANRGGHYVAPRRFDGRKLPISGPFLVISPTANAFPLVSSRAEAKPFSLVISSGGEAGVERSIKKND